MPSPPLSSPTFAVGLEFSSARVVVRMIGEVDRLAAPELAAVLGAATALGHPDIVVVLDGVTAIAADGLDVLSLTSRRLELEGRSLALIGPTSIVRRSLAGAGLRDRIRPDAHGAHPVPGSGQMPAAPRAAWRPATPEPASPLGRMASIPADRDVVDAALRLVVTLAATTVAGADGVSVSLRRHGRLATAASSDRTVLDMDANQYATGEGPCVDAASQGRRLHVDSLEAETRWPTFRPRAEALGIKAIISSPLLVSERPVGALNLYSRRTGSFRAPDVELAAVFATEASAILANAGLDVTADQVSERVAEALWVRQVIAQAQGVLMATEGLEEGAAYAVLRRRSAESSRPLVEHAAAVVSAAVAGSLATAAPEGGVDDA